MIAGSCRQCHSDVQLANGLYFCQCGSASDKSYYFPPSWVFKRSPAEHWSTVRPRLRRGSRLGDAFRGSVVCSV
jgi:hypothetical protein